MESRTMNGNSPCAARVPPTTGEGAAWAAERGWRLAIARAAAPTAANLLSAVRSFFKVLPSVGGWLDLVGTCQRIAQRNAHALAWSGQICCWIMGTPRPLTQGG